MPDSAHGGDHWQPRTDNISDELGTIWADCGVSSECGTLRSVLLHRPGKEIEGVERPEPVLWTELLNPTLAREQHDKLAEVYRAHGVEVLYVNDAAQDKPNLYFVRDLFTMTPQGAIISRPASSIRAGEERLVAQSLTCIGVPILLSVHGNGVFEGPDLVFLEDDLALVGYGLRTNEAGVRQVSHLLKEMGIEVVLVQTTYGCGHLDGVMNIVDHRKVLVYPTRVSYVAYEAMKRLGFTILDLPDTREAEIGMAINVVALAPGHVIMPTGNPQTRELLERNGIGCYEVQVSELMKGGGATHCMTGVLKRDKIKKIL